MEPVKLNLRTIAFEVSSPPTAIASPGTTLRIPLGTPARSPNSHSANAEKGVSGAGLMIIGQPAASAGPAFRVIIAAGKFQGVIAAVTPTPSFTTSSRRSGIWVGMVSPYIRFASSANHSKNDEA